MGDVIVIDLDGTLCNARHRLPYVEGEKLVIGIQL